MAALLSTNSYLFLFFSKVEGGREGGRERESDRYIYIYIYIYIDDIDNDIGIIITYDISVLKFYVK